MVKSFGGNTYTSSQGKLELPAQAPLQTNKNMANITNLIALQQRILELQEQISYIQMQEGLMPDTPVENVEADSHLQSKTLIAVSTIVVTLIVSVSIAFEKGQDWLEEHTIDVLMPVLKGIFGELTILGFIGLLMFMVTKVGKNSLNALVCQADEAWWGLDDEICPHNTTTGKWEPEMGCPENPLIELTETAHMILFFVMMLFMAQAVMLIELASNHLSDWARYEDKCALRDIESALSEHSMAKAHFKNLPCCITKCTGCYKFVAKSCYCFMRKTESYKTWYTYRDSAHFLEYIASRSAFLKTYNSRAHSAQNSDHTLRGDFDYCEYSMKTLAHSLKDIVEITPKNWALLWVIFALFLGADYIDLQTKSGTKLLMSCAVFGGYISCILVILARNKVNQIKSLLVHPLHLHDEHPLRKRTVHAREITGIKTSDQLNTDAVQAKDENEQPHKGAHFVRRLSKAKVLLQGINTPLLSTSEFSSNTKNVMTRPDTPPNLSDRQRERRQSVKVTLSKDRLLEELGLVKTRINEEHKPLYRYHYDGTELEEPPATAICGCVGEHIPNHHEALFWGGKHGPELFFAYIRTQMVVVSLYLGVSIVVFRQPLVEYFDTMDNHFEKYNVKTWGPLAVGAVALIPVLFLIFELSEVIPLLVRISSTELMVDGDSVNATLRIMKSRLALRALHNISCFMADIDQKADQCQTAALKSSVFNQLNSNERAALMSDCEMHNYPPGKTIIKQGQLNDTMYVISQGYAEVKVDGKSVAVLPPGKEFGEISMVGGHRCNADVIVKTRMIVFALHKSAYKRHLQGKNMFRERMIKSNPENPKLRNSVGIFTRGGRRRSLVAVINHRKSSHAKLLSDSQLESLSNHEKVGAPLVTQQGSKSESSFDGLYNLNGERKDQEKKKEKWEKIKRMLRSDEVNNEATDDVLNQLAVDTTQDGKADMVLIDLNGDGNIDSVGMDTNGDGNIDTYQKWIVDVPDALPGSLAAILQKKKSKETLAQQRKIALTDLFYVIDKQGDGSIEEDELREFLESVSYIIPFGSVFAFSQCFNDLTLIYNIYISLCSGFPTF